MMINVFICEDQNKQRDRLIKVIADYILMENLDMEIVLPTPNPYELLKYVKERNIIDGLYFLGIDFATEINGLELAVEIRKYDKRGIIAFVSNNRDAIRLVYKYYVEAIDYISKENFDNMKKKIIKCIYFAQKRLIENKEKRFVFKVNDRIISRPYNDILLFEKSIKNKNKIRLVTLKESFEFYGTLKEIEGVFESFYRIGGSYVFNMENVKDFIKPEGKVVMINELKYYIPMRHSKTFVENMRFKKEDGAL